MTPDPHPGAPGPDPDDLPGLDARDEALVRRLLAGSAPPAGALPADVAARLDVVLAGLHDERTMEEPGRATPAAPGDDLAARRHRRRSWLLVAAAVVVVGTGIGLLPRQGGSNQNASSAASAARVQDGMRAQDSASGHGPSASSLASGFATYDLTGPRPALHTASLPADVARVAATRDALRATAGLPGGSAAKDLARYRCALPAPVRGAALVAVRLDGKPATLVLGPATDGTRVARVYACGNAARPVTRVSLPAR
ncbi:MAG: hypothetical protein ACXVW6_01785 [Nocardioidaceae bacterium]